jgi:hypothetical protein
MLAFCCVLLKTIAAVYPNLQRLIYLWNYETFIFFERINWYEAKEENVLLKKILKLIFKSKSHYKYSSSSDAWKKKNHYNHNNHGHHYYKKKYKSGSFFSS